VRAEPIVEDIGRARTGVERRLEAIRDTVP
jgi:hypothetical protein